MSDITELDRRLVEICTRQAAEANEILTPVEVAAMLKVNKATIYAMSRESKIPAYRIGRLWRYNKREILKLVQHGRELR